MNVTARDIVIKHLDKFEILSLKIDPKSEKFLEFYIGFPYLEVRFSKVQFSQERSKIKGTVCAGRTPPGGFPPFGVSTFYHADKRLIVGVPSFLRWKPPGGGFPFLCENLSRGFPL